MRYNLINYRSLKEAAMRRYSQLAIVFSHTSPDEIEIGTTVKIKNGASSIEVKDFDSALALMPPESEVFVKAEGTVDDKTVHRISNSIKMSSVFVALDLSAVTECSRVTNNPFEKNKNILSMVFPKNLLSINPRAFAECTRLSSVVIPITTQKIGRGAFLGCDNLTHLEFLQNDGWNAGGSATVDLSSPTENPALFTRPNSLYSKCELSR